MILIIDFVATCSFNMGSRLDLDLAYTKCACCIAGCGFVLCFELTSAVRLLQRTRRSYRKSPSMKNVGVSPGLLQYDVL